MTRAEAFVRTLEPRSTATIVTLSGVLGAGKTAFAQGIAQALGVTEMVTSPTFVLEKIYQLPALSGIEGENQKFSHLIHIDAYRLKGAEELEVLGWRELIAEPGNLIVLEWPEKVADAIPSDAIRIHFEIEGDGRIIDITRRTLAERSE